MDIQGRESVRMKDHTSPNSERMGAPTGKFSSIGNQVKVVNTRREATHIALDFVRSYQLDRGRGGIPIDRERGYLGVKTRVQDLEPTETLKATIGRRTKAESIRVGVPLEQLLLAMLAIFLGSESRPEAIGNREGVL